MLVNAGTRVSGKVANQVNQIIDAVKQGRPEVVVSLSIFADRPVDTVTNEAEYLNYADWDNYYSNNSWTSSYNNNRD